jgi:hypothetical protein
MFIEKNTNTEAQIKSEGDKPVDANNFTQRVEKRAYELYVKRGSESGHEWDDWLAAERQVESEISTVDRDCIRSESFYEATHRTLSLPSGIDPLKITKSSQVSDFNSFYPS